MERDTAIFIIGLLFGYAIGITMLTLVIKEQKNHDK
jgi:hypothetical protein